LVEKPPVTLKGNVKKDEAEALKKKLEENGGTITLK
jgi:ribosomal protein L7/L12